MTALSYAVSALKESNYKEPRLLGMLLQGWVPSLKEKQAHLAGLCIHYSLGLVWAGLYIYWLEQMGTKPGLKTKLAFGGVSGLVGMLIWKWMFRKNPRTDESKFRGFEKHLIAAHIVFSIATAETYFRNANSKNLK